MGILQDSMRTAMETRGYSESTVAAYLMCVRVFAHHFGRSPLEVSTGEIESFFHFLREQKRSDSTIHLYYVSLRFFYRLNNVTNRVPSLTFKRIRYRVPVVLSQEKVAMILDSCRSLKYKTTFALAYASGLRISELRNLTVGDIDFDRKQIYVRRGKNGRSRYSILGNKAVQLLRTSHHEPARSCQHLHDDGVPPHARLGQAEHYVSNRSACAAPQWAIGAGKRVVCGNSVMQPPAPRVLAA